MPVPTSKAILRRLFPIFFPTRPTGRERQPTGREREPTGRERQPTGRERQPTGRERQPTGRENENESPGRGWSVVEVVQ